MRRFRQLCAASVLTLALAITALAGDLQVPSVIAPPPSSMTSTSSVSDSSQVDTTVASESDLLVDSALIIIADTLSVF